MSILEYVKRVEMYDFLTDVGDAIVIRMLGMEMTEKQKAGHTLALMTVQDHIEAQARILDSAVIDS